MILRPSWELLVREASRKGLLISTVESCTGGYIASRITDVPGASVCFLGGFVVYSDGLKCGLLGVDQSMIARFGAVSREVAEEMLRACLDNTGSDLSVAVTGIAGPGGGTKEKPVGTVFISVGRKGADPQTEGFLIQVSDRSSFKEEVAERVLGLLLGKVIAPSSAKP